MASTRRTVQDSGSAERHLGHPLAAYPHSTSAEATLAAKQLRRDTMAGWLALSARRLLPLAEEGDEPFGRRLDKTKTSMN